MDNLPILYFIRVLSMLCSNNLNGYYAGKGIKQKTFPQKYYISKHFTIFDFLIGNILINNYYISVVSQCLNVG